MSASGSIFVRTEANVAVWCTKTFCKGEAMQLDGTSSDFIQAQFIRLQASGTCPIPVLSGHKQYASLPLLMYDTLSFLSLFLNVGKSCNVWQQRHLPPDVDLHLEGLSSIPHISTPEVKKPDSDLGPAITATSAVYQFQFSIFLCGRDRNKAELVIGDLMNNHPSLESRTCIQVSQPLTGIDTTPQIHMTGKALRNTSILIYTIGQDINGQEYLGPKNGNDQSGSSLNPSENWTSPNVTRAAAF
ncbi:hypothetical protein EV401DRAFT_1881938 [Pisolithus croceorrhizus]|nr:hypothetical protein EV401DRAFT_1881938 [Pisolithus croceorrhizus]